MRLYINNRMAVFVILMSKHAPFIDLKSRSLDNSANSNWRSIRNACKV